MFKQFCEEGLIGLKLGAMRHIVPLKDIRVDGYDLLLLVDRPLGAQELSKCYDDGLLWEKMDGGRKSWWVYIYSIIVPSPCPPPLF
jgi:hypothetical protein